ncbi:fused MFS/spermidine synthase [Candidatus Saccharibacteria bacterium]|nr:fused MFS/spermidine synthase [Candidatus Saccharibacteria bacterium]
MLSKSLGFVRDWRLEVVAFLVGMTILAFELTASRIVAPYLGASIYTWTSIIGVIMGALAAGYAIGGVLADRYKRIEHIVWLLLGAAACIAIVNLSKDTMLSSVTAWFSSLQTQAFWASMLLFVVPTVCMGAIMPYLTKLNITDLGSSGQKVSRIDAASTIGSIAGTFLTGYVLFELIGTPRMLTLLSITLVLASFLLVRRRLLWVRLAVLTIVVLPGFFPTTPKVSGFKHEEDTAYARIIIRDVPFYQHDVRVLQSDSQGVQSGVRTDGSKELVMPYVQNFSYISEVKPDARRHLIIGGGAFTFPEHLARKYPKSHVDVVEIDGKLADISRRHFNFEPTGNLSVIPADGRQFLNKNQTAYSTIFLDAFNAIVPPFQLMTRQAVQEMHRSLETDGVVAANVLGSPEGHGKQLVQAAYSTFAATFKHVGVYQVAPMDGQSSTQNMMIVASDDPRTESRLAERLRAHVELDHMRMTKLPFRASDRLVMHDDFAPVERYSQ